MATRTKPSKIVSAQTYPSLIDDAEIAFGPAALFGRFILEVQEQAQQLGVHLSFASMQTLLEVNQKNPESWLPLISLFDHRFNPLDATNSFCIVGRDRSGEIVATQAARLYDWSQTNFRAEAESLRLFYADPAGSKLADERIDVHALAAQAITGSVAFTGAAWYRPDYRGKGLLEIMPRFSRVYALARWNVDLAITMMSPTNVKKGVYPRNGQKNIEWTIAVQNSRMGSHNFSLQWTKRHENLEDAEDFLTNQTRLGTTPAQARYA
ncbi:MAG: hypothetical protein AB7U66_18410 [Hyphomicrobiaceae bacterium]|uniref:hypothetical protein n=1 Tax=Bradyrhizobium sp. TaxID=376 RepID=UPI003D151E34